MRLAMVEKMKRFYCWIKDSNVHCLWLSFDPREGFFTDCTEMDDEQFASHIKELEKICQTQRKFNELPK